MNTTDFSAFTRLPVVEAIAKAFSAEGVEIALVGGFVRDAINGDLSDDLDFTTNLTPTQFRPLLASLGTVWEAGADFGTLAVNLFGEKVEVTTYRSETYEEGSRKPVVGFGDSLVDDLGRRDLTINAMALSLGFVNGEVTAVLVDPFGGAKDLQAGVLRTPTDGMQTMSDDPLRILRAVRFAALRGMRMDDSLVKAIEAKKDRLEIVALERKLSEFNKMTKTSKFAARSLRLAATLGLEKEIFGSLFSTKAAEALSSFNGNRQQNLLLMALAAGVNEDALRQLRMPNADVKALKKDLDTAAQLTSDSSVKAMRRLLFESKGQGLEEVFDVLDALGFKTERERELFAHLLETEKDLFEPLAVNGNDALSLGLLGVKVKLALDAAKEELFTTGQLSHQRGLEVLREQLN